MAQSTNVYSLNAVGYINVTIETGWNIVSCPLIASPDNTLNTLLPNTTGEFKGWSVDFFTGGQGYTQIETGAKTSWAAGGTNTIDPGQAVFINNPGSAVTVTFVGTVPQGSVTNTLAPGYNLVGSIIPASGDLVTNTITDINSSAVKGDTVYVNDPVNGFSSPGGIYIAAKNGAWAGGDPIVPNVGEGFFYQNNSGSAENWVENFSVSQ
jgi:hypothetical protein